jgi:WD40 repeat protein
LNSVVADALPTAFGGNFAFWSPDARALAADTTTGLQRLRLPDGTPELITTLKGPVLGGTWSETGALLFAQVTSAVELYTVPAGGGSAAKIELPGVGEGGYFWPEFLPGGNDFLVSFQPRGAPLPDVYLATLRDGKAENPVRLMTNPTAASFTPAAGGRLLFVRSDTLYSQSLNLTRRSLEGDPEVVVRGVASSPIFRAASFSVSRTGVVAWRPGREAISQLTTFDRQGKSLGTTGPAGLLLSVKLSPDERHVLVSSGTDVWMAEIDQPGRQILSQDAFPTTWAWSSKTSQFLVPRGLRLFERPLSAIEDKSAEHEIGRAEGLVRIEDVSSDGRSVLFTPGPNSTALFSLSLDTHMSSPVLQSGEYVFNARFSPDGKWIVFEAYPAGDLATRPGGIYVQPFPKGPRRQVSGTGQYPVWRRDGKEIVFHDFMRGGIASIAVQPIGADLKFGNSETLFTVRWPSESVSDVTPMAVSRDGSRIYLPQPMDQPDSNVIHVRTGWTSH